MRVVGHGKIAMAEVATAIASPCIQSSLCLQSTVEPLPASTVRLKKGLRRYTKGPSSKETPKGRILTVCLKSFLLDASVRKLWTSWRSLNHRRACQCKELISIQIGKDGVEDIDSCCDVGRRTRVPLIILTEIRQRRHDRDMDIKWKIDIRELI